MKNFNEVNRISRSIKIKMKQITDNKKQKKTKEKHDILNIPSLP